MPIHQEVHDLCMNWRKNILNDTISYMNKKWVNWPIVLFFLLLLVAGILIYKDYGIPWDEPLQIKVAQLNINYLTHRDPALLTYRDRYYGMVFELPLLWLTNRYSIPRHLQLFLIFFAGTVIFYLLAARVLHSRGWGLLAAALLVLSPRIFANGFYNSKDIPFLFISAAAVLTLLVLIDHIRSQRGWGYVIGLGILHAIVSAAMIGTRIPGVLILVLTAFAMVVLFVQVPALWAKILALLTIYSILTVGLVVLIYPVFWHDPLREFFRAFHGFSHQASDIPMLFRGEVIHGAKLPWTYLPVWIGITTPVLVLATFLPGLGNWIGVLWRWAFSRRQNTLERENGLNQDGLNVAILLLWLALPLISVYYFHSVLYDTWRHLYFIYPPIVLISVSGIQAIYSLIPRMETGRWIVRVLTIVLIFIGLLEPLLFIVRYHPYENVYFNFLAGDPATLGQRYDMDYWGLSYKQAIDYILANDARPNIKIAVSDPPGFFYIDGGLPLHEQVRLEKVELPQSADYFVTDFRFHPEGFSYPDEVYSISVRGSKIMAVYKMH